MEPQLVRFREQVERKQLEALSRSPAAFEALVRRTLVDEPLSALEAELARILALPLDPDAIPTAARAALAPLLPHLTAADRAALELQADQVKSREIGPSRLKASIYNLAQRHGLTQLLENAWFHDLMDRTETRRLLDAPRDAGPNR